MNITHAQFSLLNHIETNRHVQKGHTYHRTLVSLHKKRLIEQKQNHLVLTQDGTKALQQKIKNYKKNAHKTPSKEEITLLQTIIEQPEKLFKVTQFDPKIVYSLYYKNLITLNKENMTISLTERGKEKLKLTTLLA